MYESTDALAEIVRIPELASIDIPACGEIKEYCFVPVPKVLVNAEVERVVPTVVAMLESPEIVGGALITIVKASFPTTPSESVAVTVS